MVVGECPKCGQKLKKTDRLPPKGYDPRMKQFVCPLGHYTVYKAPKHVTS